jgi:hypothetical protein
MIRWLVPMLLASLGFASPAAADQWSELYRPLDLPELAADEPCPVSPVDERVDWESANIFGTSGTGPGPVYPGLGGEPPGVLELTGGRTDDGWFREKLFWYVKPSYRGRALLRGDRLDGPGRLTFVGTSIRGRSREMRLKPNGGTSWSGRPQGSRGFPGGVAVRGSGCYGVQFDGTRFSRTVVFSVTRSE